MAKAFWCESFFIGRIHAHVSRESNFVKLKLLPGFTGVYLLCIKFLSIFRTIDKLEIYTASKFFTKRKTIAQLGSNFFSQFFIYEFAPRNFRVLYSLFAMNVLGPFS